MTLSNKFVSQSVWLNTANKTENIYITDLVYKKANKFDDI